MVIGKVTVFVREASPWAAERASLPMFTMSPHIPRGLRADGGDGLGMAWPKSRS